MEIKRDSFWDCFSGAETLETYCEKIVPKLELKEVVPREVMQSVDIVRKLLQHAYFEYCFLDPAMSKMLSTFEMALKIRYREIGEHEQNKNLKSLMHWFNNNGYFEYDRPRLLDALRRIRNGFAHPDVHFKGGLGVMRVFDHCCSMINDLYEDRDLRKIRNEQKAFINRQLKEMTENGCFIYFFNQKYIIYSAEVILIDNVHLPISIYCYYKTIFNLKDDKAEDKIQPFTSIFETSGYELDEERNSLIFNTEFGKFVFSPIHDQFNLTRFKDWKEAFLQCRESQSKNLIANSEIDKYWSTIKRKMHFRNEGR